MTTHHVTIGQTGGITTVLSHDTADHKFVTRDIMSHPALRAFLDMNAQIRLAGFNKKAPGRITHHIPMTEWINWKDEWNAKAKNVMSWQEFQRRKLESGDYNAFRVTPNDSYKLRRQD